MKNISFNLKYVAFAAICVFGFSACVDLNFDEPIATGICNSDNTANMTIAELKAMHTFGNEEDITEDLIISGVVIGDDAAGNFYKKLVIQDETAGIEVFFGSTDLYNQFPKGTEVFINCNGLKLSDYNGVTQIGTIEQAVMGQFICKGATNITPNAKEIAISDLSIDDISMLIKLTNVQFANGSAGATYADPVNLQSVNLVVESCESNDDILLRTSGFSDFAGFVTPTGSGTITAVYSVFGDDQQLYINNTSDVEFDNDRCGYVVVGGDVNESFEENALNNVDIDILGWSNFAVKGTRKWRGKEFDDNLYAQGTSFGDDNEEMESWLITPGIDLSTPMKLNFDSQVGFSVAGHDGLKVYISTDYDGSNFASASWTELDAANVANSSSSENTWINSGDVDLTSFSGTGYIGFQYIGSGPNGLTSSFRLDNIVIEAQ